MLELKPLGYIESKLKFNCKTTTTTTATTHTQKQKTNKQKNTTTSLSLEVIMTFYKFILISPGIPFTDIWFTRYNSKSSASCVVTYPKSIASGSANPLVCCCMRPCMTFSVSFDIVTSTFVKNLWHDGICRCCFSYPYVTTWQRSECDNIWLHITCSVWFVNLTWRLTKGCVLAPRTNFGSDCLLCVSWYYTFILVIHIVK